MCDVKKNLNNVRTRCLAVILLLSGGILFWVHQSRAYSSFQDKSEWDEGVILWEDETLRARILNSNPEADSYLTYNPFSMTEIRSSLAAPDPTISGEDMSLFSAPITIMCVPRPPVRVPVRPPLRSPCVPLP